MNSGVLVAASGAVVACAVLTRPMSARMLRRRLGLAQRLSAAERRHRMRPVALVAVAGTGVALFAELDDRPHVFLMVMTGLGVAYAGVALRRKGLRRAVRQRRQAETVGICDAIVAELDAGTPPMSALVHVSRDWPAIRPAAQTAELGGDVAQTLRGLARQPGRASLRDIAAAWDVSLRSGAGLAGVLDRLSAALRQDDETRQEVNAALGAPRATARVLAVLPVFGLALGSGIGGDPVAVLLETMLGAICLAAGSALAVAGLFWVEHIADAAELM